MSDNTCLDNPARQFSDHCFHDTDDGRHTVCCWCGFKARHHVPADSRGHGDYLPRWLRKKGVTVKTAGSKVTR